VQLAGVERPLAAAGVLLHALADRQRLVAGAVLLAAAAALLPLARKHGRRALAGFALGFLALALLPAPDPMVIPLVAGVWATCVGLAIADRRRA
jgi:hypothetical protein